MLSSNSLFAARSCGQLLRLPFAAVFQCMLTHDTWLTTTAQELLFDLPGSYMPAPPAPWLRQT